MMNSSKELTWLAAVIIPEHAPASDLLLMKVYNVTDDANFVGIYAKASTGVLKLTANFLDNDPYSQSVEGTIDICDGDLHWIAFTLKPGRFFGWTDNETTTVVADSDLLVPVYLDFISYEPSGAFLGGVHTWPMFQNHRPRPTQKQTIRVI